VGDRDAGGSELADDGDIEVDAGIGRAEIGKGGLVRKEFTQRTQS
jgi:hypothetical protein